MNDLYNYIAIVRNVVDGDTIDVDIDLGFDIHKYVRVRLANIDTPELNSKSILQRQAATKVKEYVKKALLNQTVYLKTIKSKDKDGEYLADIWIIDENDSLYSFNTLLTIIGYAVEYINKKHNWSQDDLDFILEN